MNNTLLLSGFSYFYSLVFFIGSFFSFIGFADAKESEEDFGTVEDEYDISDHTFTVEDLYIKTYNMLGGGNLELARERGEIDAKKEEKNIKEKKNAKDSDLQKKAYSSVAIGMGITAETLHAMMLDDPRGMQEEYCPKGEDKTKCVKTLLRKHCPNPDSLTNSFVQCQKTLQSRISAEYERSKFEQSLHSYALASQAFTNGTLQDTGSKSFDIVVDLNIIDLVLFGDKMTIPRTGSPFLPTFPLNGDDDKKKEESSFNEGWEHNNGGQKTDSGNNNGGDGSDDSDGGGNTDGGNTDGNDDEGFCADPDSRLFSDSITSQYLGVNENKNETVASVKTTATEEGNNYSPAQLGNLVPPQIKYSGGVYPDLSAFGGSKKCDADEKSYFQGRLCIPEFCPDLICIKIKFTMEKTRSQKLDCVECHIDRANEALNPFVATLGQGTPNQNSMEPFFLSAFANLFKDVTKSITLKPKRLPFMLYDVPLNKQKKEKEDKKRRDKLTQKERDSEDSSKKENKEKKEKIKQLEENRELYDLLLLEECYELSENFKQGEGYVDEITKYCSEFKIDSLKLSEGYLEKVEKDALSNDIDEERSKGRSETFHTVVEPFFWQMSKDMVTINNHIQDIDPKVIQKTGQSCTSRIQK